MVTAGIDEIRLVLSVDRADIERQLSKGFDASMGKAPQKAPKGSLLSPEDQKLLGGFREQRRQQKEVEELKTFQTPKEEAGEKKKPTKVNPGKSFIAVLAPLAALFGISLGITGLLKSSKIMQTTANAFGQILGAMIDMLLMPFMPLIVDMLRGLISMLPKINQWAEDNLVPAVNKLRETLTEWWDEYGPAIINIVTTLKDLLGPIAGFVWDQFLINLERLITVSSNILTAVSSIVDFVGSIKLPGWMTNKEGGNALAAEGSGGLFGKAKDYESKYTIEKTAIAAFKGVQNIINIVIDRDGKVTVEGGSKGGSVSANLVEKQGPGSPP